MDSKAIDHRFTFHPAQGSQPDSYETIRSAARAFAHVVNELAPDSEEKERAVDAVDDAVMRANAAIARHTGAVLSDDRIDFDVTDLGEQAARTAEPQPVVIRVHGPFDGHLDFTMDHDADGHPVLTFTTLAMDSGPVEVLQGDCTAIRYGRQTAVRMSQVA